MTISEKLNYVLNLFKTNKMDMQLSTIKGLIPESIKPELPSLLNTLTNDGYLDFRNSWWSATVKGRNFKGFDQAADKSMIK